MALRDRYLSPSEAAAILDVHRVTIYNWVKAGALRLAPKLGSHKRLFLSDVAEKSGMTEEWVMEELEKARALRPGRGNFKRNKMPSDTSLAGS